MHIPSSPTAALTLERFAPALEAALLPSPDYDVSRWLYVPNRYSEYRYILGTRGKKPLICMGINPSTAAPDALDPTLRSVQRIAASNGFDSFLMFNVYAQRATRPDDMERVLNPELHAENREAFRYLLSLSPTPAVWCAWAMSSRSGTTLPAAWGTSSRTARPWKPSGSAPGRSSSPVIPTIPST